MGRTSGFAGVGAVALALSGSCAGAADLEVTHWWTSGGEAAAVAELARAFNATGNRWVDAAIAGSGGTARPIMVGRITGGDPMGATQFNHGRQAEELVAAGLMRDLTAVAERDGWRAAVYPPSLLDSCTIDGRIYCAPVNIHSNQWLWLSNAAFGKAGVPVPTDWTEFVAAAPQLRAAGILPLAMGNQPWQSNLAFGVLAIAIAGTDAWQRVYMEKDAEAAAGPEFAAVWQAADAARRLREGSNVLDWNQATNLVITGQAGGQIMGDWAQGEFALAGQVAGTDYSCLPGLGMNDVISTGGDAFYFPVSADPAVSEAQLVLAATLVNPDTQVAFNLRKGSLPVRGDVSLDAANDCMRKGLEILAAGKIMPDANQQLSPDTQGQLEDLMTQFWSSDRLDAAQAQARFADIIRRAD